MPNKYQHLQTPQAEFDFHDRGPMTHGEILNLADNFVKDCHHDGYKIISIITGTGIHSKNGPVIKPIIADFLASHPMVANFSEGKHAQGGQGVFIIKLKKF